MPARILDRDDLYVLNFCAKHLARANLDPRHAYDVDTPSEIARISEAWRFPIIDGFFDAESGTLSGAANRATFVFVARDSLPERVGVVGTFSDLYDPLPLGRIPDTPYFALTALVPRGEVHTYKLIVDGQALLDPINPQRTTLDNGETWSRFFTEACTTPLVLESWEWRILERLTRHILPFRTEEAENFLARFYEGLDRGSRAARYRAAYRFDESVGVVNFIDKLLAREEMHHRIDYAICLELIDRVMRTKNPFVEPYQMTVEEYVELYEQLGRGQVPHWDYGRYNNPRYFLKLLRRHSLTGAFSHPKYGGNAGAAAWAWLSERYRDETTGETLFEWMRALEAPLGTSPAYRG